MIIHIDTDGMNDKEKTVTIISEIFKYINIPHKKTKKKAKDIREQNRKREKYNRTKKKYNL